LVLAGAGGSRGIVEVELVIRMEGDGGKDLEWLG
jgi:hypothetical protein